MEEQAPASYTVRLTSETEASGLPFSQADWDQTPKAIQAFVISTLTQFQELRSKVDKIDSKLKQDSKNSNRPPSSDSPYKRKPKDKKKRKPGGKKGHPGNRQLMLEPTQSMDVKPERCSCGSEDLGETRPYHVHQMIELPEIKMDVFHWTLHEARCARCGKLIKAHVPKGCETGYGPKLTALIGDMAGNQGNSRASIMEFCQSFLKIPISKGAVQKVIDRVSASISDHYDAIAQAARQAKINYIDETSWRMCGSLMWLWVMVNTNVAFFMIHPKRSKEAFAALIEDWDGILVSDGYGVYKDWVNLRQTCLAHLIRTADGLAQRSDPEIAAFGKWAAAEIRRLCDMAHAPPTIGEWRAFYARLSRLINNNLDRKDDAGKFARRLLREMESLWVFLAVKGVEPTNNRGERSLRFGVIWRKRSFGTSSDKGNRWVERILSLRQTCRLQGRPMFSVLVEAVDCHFKGSSPDLSWISAE
ncbi:MAG: IS66 family transposase [Syntrophobacteraceae bacterium]